MLDPCILQHADALFGADPAQCHYLGGMEGHVYEFARDGQSYVLKVTPTSAAALPGLLGEIEFIHYLGQHGVSVAQPIASSPGGPHVPLLSSLPERNRAPMPDLRPLSSDQERRSEGHLVEIITSPDATYAVTAFVKAPGRPPEHSSAEWNATLFYAWGRVTGHIHALTQHYQPNHPRWDWREENADMARHCPDPDLLDRWQRLDSAMHTLSQDVTSYGLIHNDLHPWNFHYDTGHLVLFDFGSCGYHWFVNDIAIPLYWAQWSGPAQQGLTRAAYLRGFLRAFWDGYRSANALDPAWLAHLPLFVEHRQLYLVIYFTHRFQGDPRLRDWLLGDAPRRVRAGEPAIEMDDLGL
jgi:amicoumacin kinase